MADQKNEKQLTLKLSSLWKISTFVLFVAVLGLVFYTQPWDRSGRNPRTITIKGEVSLKRAPDSFIFNPSFEAESQEAINNKTKEVVAAVKDLGLGDAGIQTSVSSYEDYYGMEGRTGKMRYSVYLTLSVEDKELAQKIQDYLATSGATGQISPQVGFTKDTLKSLKDEATTLAVEDAKRRAQQTAQNLGVRIVRVLTINEPSDDFGIYPIASYSSRVDEGVESLPINAGESDFSYSINVEFEIR